MKGSPFEFATATRIIFGRGTLRQAGPAVSELGKRALVVTGKTSERAAPLLDLLQQAGLRLTSFSIQSEPTVAEIRAGAEAARDCDVVIGFGGGSALDAAKAIAPIATNSGEPLDYLEVVGKGGKLEAPPLPFLAIPTTSGTGAEVTRNAVLDSTEHGVKASLRGAQLLARVAVVDPDLTLHLPPAVTARSGLDALTQLIEAYVSCRANRMTDLFCQDGIPRAARALGQAFKDGRDVKAREDMSWASLLSGLALSNAGLGVVHGFAAPLGGTLHAAHGAICAAILPHGMHGNLRALRQRSGDEGSKQTLERYRQVAVWLTSNAAARAEDGIQQVLQLCGELKIQSLNSLGLSRDQIPEMVRKAAQASSMKANPIVLSEEELTQVLIESL